MSDIREAFEAWAKDNWLGGGEDFQRRILSERTNDGQYKDRDLRALFIGYEAALQSQTAPAVPEGCWIVPFQPTKDQWGGLARDLMMWLDMNRKRPTGASLYEHLESLEVEPPEWLKTEVLDNDHVPSKGTRCAVIYKAMLDAAPQPDHSPAAGEVELDLASLDKAYCMGWIKASEWGECEDLISDMDSPAFEEEKAATLTYIRNKYATPTTDDGIDAVLKDTFNHGTGFAVVGETGFAHVDRGKVLAAPAAEGGEVEQLREELAEMKRLFGTAMEVADFPDAHPAQPRNDQVAALEKFARDCGLFDSAYDDQGYIEIPRWRFKEYIARLRASQQEGE